MATASGDASGTRRSVIPYVAYAVILSLLGGAGVAFWARDRGSHAVLPSGDRTSPPVPASAPAPIPSPTPAPPEPSRAAPGLKLPPRSTASAANAVVAQNPAPSPVPIPSPSPPPPAVSSSTAPSSAASAGDPAAVALEPSAPAKSKCTVDGTWPSEKMEQGKAIQGMLRDLGLYDGTVYGTVGPATRAAIRKFQVAAGEPETGEPGQALFESLKKKCAASGP